MKSVRLATAIAAIILSGALSASAQMGMGMMGGNVPEDIAKMMQEQNKVLAQASIQYMTVFTNSLHAQSKERRDQIDAHFIHSAFAEMKRAYEMIEKFQSAHVKTMNDTMQERVNPMMERMNRTLASIKENLDELEKEINGGRDLDKITLLAEETLKRINDLPRRPGGMQGSPGDRPPMMK